MAKNVLVVLVLDETGSMESIKDRTISSVNEYFEGLKPQGKACHVSIVKFNSMHVSPLCSDVPVKDVPELDVQNYTPNHNTPLYDAVAKTIKETDAVVEKSKVKPDILFVVVTDGEENSSVEYHFQQVADLIKERETKGGWTFIYLGANQDSWKSASTMGYSNVGNTMNYKATRKGIVEGLAGTSFATNRYFENRNAFYSAMASSGVNTDDAAYSEKDTLSFTAREEDLDKSVAKFTANVLEKEKKPRDAKS